MINKQNDEKENSVLLIITKMEFSTINIDYFYIIEFDNASFMLLSTAVNGRETEILLSYNGKFT